jgi:glycosyltransferase involved in cell wall biosynthesis
LFVELSVDVSWSLLHGRRPALQSVRPIAGSDRLWALAPRKWLPRRIWPRVNRSLANQVLRASRKLALVRPVLWINDNDYAELVSVTRWPAVYDVTDDWTLGFDDQRTTDRQRENDQRMLDLADEVVVCSSVLVESRGRTRPVHLIPNGVDIEHFRTPRPRPADLPPGRIVLYTGTLVGGRLDLALCAELARRLTGVASLVFVGPSSLTAAETHQLRTAGAVLLDRRPYDEMPAYLQYADVIVVPHLVTPFTESLDPIKAREIVAVGRPAVSTPVAGFRDAAAPIVVADAAGFSDAVLARLADPIPYGPGPLRDTPGTWSQRARDFLDVLDAAARRPSVGVGEEASD